MAKKKAATKKKPTTRKKAAKKKAGKATGKKAVKKTAAKKTTAVKRASKKKAVHKKAVKRTVAKKTTESILTEERAEQFVADNKAFDLRNFTAISDDAAKVLRQHTGEPLPLMNLSHISDSAARSLSRHTKILPLSRVFSKKGRHKEIRKPVSQYHYLTSDAAVALGSQHTFLNLCGLRDISRKAAAGLAKGGDDINLNGLVALSHDVAGQLVKRRHKYYGCIYLNGISTLDASAAEALGRARNKHIYLDGLEDLPSEIAGHLSKVAGTASALSFAGVTALSDAAARELSCFQGELLLNGLTVATDSVIECLSRVHGKLDLSGLEMLSDSAANHLSHHVGDLSLDGLTSLSDAAAKSLSMNKGPVYLRGVSALSDIAAQSLSRHRMTTGCHPSLPGYIVNAIEVDLDKLSKTAAQIMIRVGANKKSWHYRVNPD